MKTFRHEQDSKKNILRDTQLRQSASITECTRFEPIMFTALLYSNGKKLNSIEKANTEYFAELMRNYDKSEEPDKVKVEFLNWENNNSLLWSKEFSLSEPKPESVSIDNSSAGLGEAEVNEIIGRKIADYERIKEVESLRTELEELSAENEELKEELEETKAQLESKKQVEYYAGLLGIAMPGLAKALEKTQAGSALGFLSGTGEAEKIENTEFDNKSTITQMVDEYMQSLEEPLLDKFYLTVCEFSKNNQ